MEILTSVKRLYISFKSLVNDFVYSFGRAALLLLAEVQNHTVPVRERGRIRVNPDEILSKYVSNLLLSCHLCLDIRGSLFYSVLPAKAMYTFPLFPHISQPGHSHPLRLNQHNIYLFFSFFFCEGYKACSSELCSLLQTYFLLLPFKPKYIHPYSIFEYSAHDLSLILETNALFPNISQRYISMSSSYLPIRTTQNLIFMVPCIVTLY